jgi:hypothetical protein
MIILRLLLAELAARLMLSLADFGEICSPSTATKDNYFLIDIPPSPSIVNVFPAPVCPYINTVPFIPSSELITIARMLLLSYTP